MSHEVTSDRLKSLAHPSTNVWMYHLELHHVDKVDDRVRGWLEDAYASAD
jgi:hypothetical protein